MNPEGPKYLSYLLRLWRVNSGGAVLPGKAGGRTHHGGDGRDANPTGVVWRATIESPISGERASFAHLDDLIDYLRQHTDTMADENKGDSDAGT
jgi:hypothetical protein